MMPYRIEFSKPAQKEFEKLDAVVKQRVSDEIVGLEKEPRPIGCKPLKGFKSVYRVRVGKFRIVYEVRDKVLLVLVIRIAKREDVYNDF
jgi:mRNA interferase RelE/StbE